MTKIEILDDERNRYYFKEIRFSVI